MTNENKIKEYLKSLPSNTRISFRTYLDFNYKIGGCPQINRVLKIENSNGNFTYDYHEENNTLQLPNYISFYNLCNYLVRKSDEKDLCKKTYDYGRGLRFFEFWSLPIKYFID